MTDYHKAPQDHAEAMLIAASSSKAAAAMLSMADERITDAERRYSESAQKSSQARFVASLDLSRARRERDELAEVLDDYGCSKLLIISLTASGLDRLSDSVEESRRLVELVAESYESASTVLITEASHIGLETTLYKMGLDEAFNAVIPEVTDFESMDDALSRAKAAVYPQHGTIQGISVVADSDWAGHCEVVRGDGFTSVGIGSIGTDIEVADFSGCLEVVLSWMIEEDV